MKVLIVSADRTLPSGAPQNIGDALLTDALAAELGRRSCEVSVADFGEGFRSSCSIRVAISNGWQLFRLMRQMDLVIVGGGTLLQDDQPGRRFGGLPRLCFIISLLGWLSGCRLVYFGVGADPISRVSARLLLWAATLNRSIYCRDRESLDRVLGLYHNRAELSADACLFGRDSIQAFRSMREHRQGIGLCLNRNDWGLADLSSVKDLKETFGEVIFVSMDQGRDADQFSLPESVSAFLQIFDLNHSWSDVAEKVARLEYVVSSRMHALYLAGMLDVPVVGVGSSPKLLSFCREFAIPCVPSVPCSELLRRQARVPDFSTAALRVSRSLDEVLR